MTFFEDDAAATSVVGTSSAGLFFVARDAFGFTVTSVGGTGIDAMRPDRRGSTAGASVSEAFFGAMVDVRRERTRQK